MNRPFLCGLFVCVGLGLARASAETAPADVIVAEDFESTAVGGIPAGYTKTGAIAVAEGVAHSGTHALKIEPAVRGGRFVTLPAEKVAALGGEQWGRLYFKVKTPTPLPVVPEGKKSAAIHTTLVAGKTTSPLANDAIEVRLAGLSLDLKGDFRYLYNVQPKQRKEFGVREKNGRKFDDAWVLLEWHADHATQTYQFFVNGEEVTDIALHKGAGQFEGAELPPAFQTLSIGWTNYQAATDEGFTVWIDDIAVGKKRLGPAAAKK